MTKSSVDLRGRQPQVDVGRITCAAAARQGKDAANVSGADGVERPYLAVTVPVTARFFAANPKDVAELIVTAEVRAPHGHLAPVAYAPSPSADYIDSQETTSAAISLRPAFLDVRGERDRTTNRQELTCDVTGVGTSRLEWTTRSGRRQLAGSHEFTFLIRQSDISHAWIEVVVELRVRRDRWRRVPVVAASGSGVAPLVADSAPQAATTLRLYEGASADAPRLFVGRPLNLPLSLASDGLYVAPFHDEDTVGAIRWFDDFKGKPGYTWLQKSSTVVTLDGDSSSKIGQDASVLLDKRSMLRFGPEHCLSVAYDTPVATGPSTLRSYLDLQVVIGGETVSSQVTTTDYVTVGRTLRDICIDRPDISRSHGVLELDKDGWTYCHKSAACEARLIRSGHQMARIEKEQAVRVRSGDILQLTEHVSLVIA